MASQDTRVQVGSIAGIQHFLSAKKSEFHPRVSAALAAVSRHRNDLVVVRTLTPAIEQAFQIVPRNVLGTMSWQGLNVYKANFSRLDLSGMDFRDANLEDVTFADAQLVGTRFDAAILKGAVFDRANLQQAILDYADLAGASLKEANLADASVSGIRVRDADFKGANLRCRGYLREQSWMMSKNWRSAHFDDATWSFLIEKYGPNPQGHRILMIMWEFPHHVTGGGWTAAYHLLRKLLQQGRAISVLVPWKTVDIDFSVFGHDLHVICAGLDFPGAGAYAMSGSYGSAYGGYGGYGEARHIIELVDEFTDAVRAMVSKNEFDCDLIHAHDWLTFPAARAVSEKLGKPWIAQFHSTEQDRQETPHTVILKIENEAIDEAHHVLAVSAVTKKHLVDNCGAPPDKVSVAYNCYTLDQSRLMRKGSFAAGNVVFVGRMGWQKGPDVFVELAKRVHGKRPTTKFKMYGDGPAREEISVAIQVAFPHPKLQESAWLEKDCACDHRRLATLVQPVELNESGAIRVMLDPINDSEQIKPLNRLFGTHGIDYTPVQGYNPYTHLVSVCSPPQGYRPDFLIKTNQLLPFDVTRAPVRLTGGLRWQDRLQAFSQATVVVVPSRAEPFGLVVLEAMECGVPVLYPNHAGVASVVGDGTWTMDDDLEKWTDETLKLLSDESRCAKWSSDNNGICLRYAAGGSMPPSPKSGNGSLPLISSFQDFLY